MFHCLSGIWTIWTSPIKIPWSFCSHESSKHLGSELSGRKYEFLGAQWEWKGCVQFSVWTWVATLALHVYDIHQVRKGELAFQPLFCKLHLWWWQTDHLSCRHYWMTVFLLTRCQVSPEQDLPPDSGYHSITCLEYLHQKLRRGWGPSIYNRN